MHTGHTILVKADSHEEAIETARACFNPEEGQSPAEWSDWCVVGDEGGYLGSRYSFRNEHEDWTGASDHAVSLDDEADLFYKVLNDAVEAREREFNRLRDRVGGVGSFSLDQDDSESWALHRFAEFAGSIYNPYSFVYDLQNYTANLRYFREAEAAGEQGWYAVLVDFHF